jgi:hypothetical protein
VTALKQLMLRLAVLAHVVAAAASSEHAAAASGEHAASLLPDSLLPIPDIPIDFPLPALGDTPPDDAPSEPLVSQENLCMTEPSGDRNMAIPSLYLLGCVKCSTTSFAKSLRDAGVKMMSMYGSKTGGAGSEGEKEWRFFDSYCSNHGPGVMCQGLKITEEVRTEFVSANEYGCDEPGTVSDVTPSNMYIVELPRVLAQLYESSVSRLSFVFLLREPLARMQSDWYFCDGCTPYGTTNFADYIVALEYHLPQNYTLLIENGLLIGADVNIMARSLYAMQLYPWMTNGAFQQSQFTVLPSGWATKNAREAVEGLFKQFPAITLDSSRVSTEPTHLMANNPHPPLDEDLDEETRDRFRTRFFNPDTEYLADLLWKGMSRGLTVGGFDDSAGVSAPKIKEHLEQWWDL